MIKKRDEYLKYLFGAVYITLPWYRKLLLMLNVSNKEIKKYNRIVEVYKESKENIK